MSRHSSTTVLPTGFIEGYHDPVPANHENKTDTAFQPCANHDDRCGVKVIRTTYKSPEIESRKIYLCQTCAESFAERLRR